MCFSRVRNRGYKYAWYNTLYIAKRAKSRAIIALSEPQKMCFQLICSNDGRAERSETVAYLPYYVIQNHGGTYKTSCPSSRFMYEVGRTKSK